MPLVTRLSRATLALGVAWLLGVPAPAQSPADLPSGREVVRRFVEAIGGADAVRRPRSQHAVGTFDVPGPGISGEIEAFSAAPNLMFQRLVVPGLGRVESGFDGVVGWLDDPTTGPMLLDGMALEQMKTDAHFYAALHGDEIHQSIETVERTTFEGSPAYKVRLITRSGDEQFEYFSVDSGLLVGSVVTRVLPMGRVPTTTVLTDYRAFGDLLLPTRWRQRAMGAEQVVTITRVEFDTVDISVFALPPRIRALVK